METNKEFDLKHSKSKDQWWRKVIIWGFIVTLLIINLRCKDCDCDDTTNGSVNDEYYVKYEVNSTTIYTGGKLNVTINTEKNTNLNLIIDQRVLWETVVGPVQKGFIATLNVSAASTTNNQLRLYTNIYVSKNGSPFALKKSDGSETPRDNVQISYTIDY